jgi:hypothetical protein
MVGVAQLTGAIAVSPKNIDEQLPYQNGACLT